MIGRAFRVILHSLRGGIFAGALLWSVGLLVFLNVLSEVAMRVMPGLRPIDKLLASLAATFFTISGLLLVGSALRRVDAVRRRVLALRSGEGTRIEGTGLAELEPLVRDMNELLDQRERVAQRALATAGDLAHGLKTPLAIVAQEVDRLEIAGQHDSAAAIHEQVERMRRQVDYHLARSRSTASAARHGSRVELRPVVERIVRTVGRLYADKATQFAIEIPDACSVRCETEDLEEMLGNVIENACKWARGSVTVAASRDDDCVAIVIDDDGPGVDATSRERVLQRGVRADEAAPGSGLGLAIVSDLVGLYGGSISLDTAPSGGLRVRVVLPSGTRS